MPYLLHGGKEAHIGLQSHCALSVSPVLVERGDRLLQVSRDNGKQTGDKGAGEKYAEKEATGKEAAQKEAAEKEAAEKEAATKEAAEKKAA